MDDVLSQGGDREPSRWPRRLAAIAASVVLAVVIVGHLTRGRAHRPAAAPAAGPVQLAGPGSGAAGLLDEPNGIIGKALPWARSLRLPVTGEQPAWFWPATGRVQPIGGLPRDRSGYLFTRVGGGWAVQADSAVQLGCGSCAGRRLPVYFLADRAQSATEVGTADKVAPAATAGALWLTSYPPGADLSTAAGTAQEVSVTGASLGRQLRLPAGYAIDQATGRGLLLASGTQRRGATAYALWDPATAQVSRTFEGVIAASGSEIAWTPRCAGQCRVHVLDLATGRDTVIGMPRASSVANGVFSPDGDFLALQLSSGSGGDGGALAMQLEVASVASGRLTVVPGTGASSDALEGFGWPAGGDNLVTELSFTTKVQVASWHPGAARLAVVAIRPGQHPTSLIVGP
jgi:hypothetical protein